MQNKREMFIELAILGVLAYAVFFVSVNVNPILGSIYALPVLLAISLGMVDYFFGSKVIKLVNKNVSWGKALMWGVGGYVALLLSTQLTTTLAEVIPLKEVLNLLAASAPVFSQSAILNFLTFGVLIAYIETAAFFIIAIDVLTSFFKVPLNKENLFNPKMILIIVGLSGAFLLYHVTAKGIENEATLILVFLMAVISLIMTIWTGDARPAIILHVLANSIASTSLFVIKPEVISILLPLIGIG